MGTLSHTTVNRLEEGGESPQEYLTSMSRFQSKYHVGYLKWILVGHLASGKYFQ